MIRKITLAAACLAVASIASAQDGCPMSVDGNDVEARPVTWRSFADAYGIANGHYLLGTADTAPPTPLVHPDCGAAGTTIARAGYVGSFEDPAATTAGDGNDIVAVFVYDANDVVASANKHAIRFRSIQNFVGNGFVLTAKILENRGDEIGSAGARGLFNRVAVAAGNNATAGGLGPFGAPQAGVFSTVVADARADRGDTIHGSCTIPGVGPLNIHDSGSGVTYATFDRSADVVLGDSAPSQDIKAAIVKAQQAGISYQTCEYSCTTPSPLIRNVGCDITVNNPLYVGVTAVPGGTSTASERLQDTLLVDNIIHLQGDTDFCGETGVGEICSVTLVSKL